MTDYYESAKGITISKKRALLELRRHSIFDYTEFFEEPKFKMKQEDFESLNDLQKGYSDFLIKV